MLLVSFWLRMFEMMKLVLCSIVVLLSAICLFLGMRSICSEGILQIQPSHWCHFIYVRAVKQEVFLYGDKVWVGGVEWCSTNFVEKLVHFCLFQIALLNLFTISAMWARVTDIMSSEVWPPTMKTLFYWLFSRGFTFSIILVSLSNYTLGSNELVM